MSAQIYVRSFAGALAGSAGKWQISASGGTEPSWRGDGKELFYVQGNTLMSVEINANGDTFQPGVPKQLAASHQLWGRLIANRVAKGFDVAACAPVKTYPHDRLPLMVFRHRGCAKRKMPK
jgi:hypothetical protein